MITPDAVDLAQLPHKKCLNVALLGALSAHLPMEQHVWLASLQGAFAPSFFEANQQAFLFGRSTQLAPKEN